MGGIIVNAKIRAVNDFKYFSPVGWACHDILSPRHSSSVKSIGQFSMAILTPYSSGHFDYGRPDFLHNLQVLGDCLIRDTSHKGCHHIDASLAEAVINFLRCST